MVADIDTQRNVRDETKDNYVFVGSIKKTKHPCVYIVCAVLSRGSNNLLEIFSLALKLH